jgi:hypothetical protein
VIGALAPYGPQPRLTYRSRTGKRDSAAFVKFLWRDVAGLPAPPEDLPALYRRARPCVIVLDNYSVHRSAVVKALLPALETVGVTFFYLPPYEIPYLLNCVDMAVGGRSAERLLRDHIAGCLAGAGEDEYFEETDERLLRGRGG